MVKDGSTRQVTFSKRRKGLFEKANDLAILCAAQVAIIVFSSGSKPFSFVQPNVQSVVWQFLIWHRPHKDDSSSEMAIVVVHENSGSEAKRGRMSEMLRRLRAEDKKRAALNRKLRSKELVDSAYKLSVDGLGTRELKECRKSLEGLRGKLRTRINELEVSVSLLLLLEGLANQE